MAVRLEAELPVQSLHVDCTNWYAMKYRKGSHAIVLAAQSNTSWHVANVLNNINVMVFTLQSTSLPLGMVDDTQL